MIAERKEDIQYLFGRIFPKKTDVNFGVILLCAYIITEFGSITGLYPILNYVFKVPYLIAVSTIGYALYLIIRKKANLNTGFAKIYILMCMFIILYAFFSTQLEGVRDGVIKSFAYYLSAYIVCVACVKQISQLILVIDVWLASILFSSIHGIAQGGLVWNNKYLSDENELALLISIALPYALIFLMLHKSKLKRLSYLICIAFYTGAQMVAHSRGGMLSFATMFFFFWLILKNKVRNLLLVLFIVIIGLSFAPPIYFEEMATLQQGVNEETADSRLYFWKKGLEMFNDNPIFGIGPLNYPYYFPQYEGRERYPEPVMRPPHSFLVQWIAELGIVGLVFLLCLQMMLFKNWQLRNLYSLQMSSKEKPEETDAMINFIHAAAIAQIAFWAGALFLSLFAYPFYWFIIFFSDALRRIMIERMNNYS